jgi:hypothetical protein
MALIDSNAWHEKIERQTRGSRNFESRHHAHQCVKIAFSFFEFHRSPQYMQTIDLLLTYEAFNLLIHYADRRDEEVFRDVISQLREYMVYRMNGLIEPEMGKSFLRRTDDDFDRLTTVGDSLAWTLPSSSKKSLYTR